MARRKTSRKRETIHLEVMPPPKGDLTKAKALAWLAEALPIFLMVADGAYDSDWRRRRGTSFSRSCLLDDIRSISGACVDVLKGELAPRFTRHSGKNADWGVKALAEILLDRDKDIIPESGSLYERTFFALEDELFIRAKLMEKYNAKQLAAAEKRAAELEAELGERAA